ncbi:hypothetical protein BX616_008380 [Lobosporangium transversale]|uniref:Uncharacterized protein n=1 Tax=Lobosporangium transversale TaxID=64571 RepID=A0A1Y2GBI8_9FUNG|nr:hypothetical protein BCR41DRAFT_362348 [Lobosporangium transversale]KAF9914411.1 hypothetical protein BX616_008380 [Lobosporangium transversale]ORZ04865.1 hypothetical protein BCR41DRAFT_362348 [Lobosporangium transversale]|eukprot:XP_021876802.1 hypothetical protein BCR41DRAFT_362348 [Lobosporangium transversale]
MKLYTSITRAALTLCLFPWVAFPMQLSFRKLPKHGHTQNTHTACTTKNLTPYTMPWVNELEAIYNSFGRARNDSACPTKIPKWNCEPYKLSEQDLVKPTDVWRLRPHDIKAVISIGDSITAGFAMISGRPPFATVLEFRGKVFSGGGDSGEYTVANFLKTYTKEVKGSPSGFTLPLAFGKGLNTAVSGAIAQTLSSQIDHLKRMFSFGGMYHKYRDEWKLATVFIGANNLCAACGPGETVPEIADPEEYGAALKSALQGLRDSVGPTFVNLVGIFDVSLVYDLSRGYSYCELLFDKLPLPICGCATGDEALRQRAGDLAKRYNEVMKRIAREINEESKSERKFGVAYQPGLTEFKDGSSAYGQGYLSGLDCFHPNKCANQLMAISVWNNMFSSNENKDTPMDPRNLEIYCPGPTDYLQ